jgi:replicative DNA helicase
MDNQRAARAEVAVLGCLIGNNASWDRIADKITESDFVLSAHRAIFSAISTLAEENEPFDIVTLVERMERDGTLSGVGGMPAIGALTESYTTANNIRSYAQIVRDQSLLRQIAKASEDAADRARIGEEDPGVILDSVQQKLGAIADDGRNGGPVGIKTILGRVVLKIDEAFNAGKDLIGVPSGLIDLDAKTSGFNAQDLVILAARPSMGKTALAVTIADHVAVNCKLPVLMFSLEMSCEAVGMRFASVRSRVPLARIRNGKLLESEDWMKLTSATSMLSGAPMLVDDTASLSITDMMARARRAQRDAGLSLVIVDYLQLMAGSGKAENRNIEVMKISQGLKAMAKTLNVPVIALSQLNRSVEQRPNKRPVMSDLRDSGGIEQDADLILFIYRDEVYSPESQYKGTAEIIIAKQRNGPIGMVRTAFDAETCRFDSLFCDWKPQEPSGNGKKKHQTEYDY